MAEQGNCFETGHCAAHGGEVERRIETKQEVDRLDKKYDQKMTDLWTFVTKCNQAASNFRGQAKIAGIVATLVFASSFIYTRGHITQSYSTEEKMRLDFETKIIAAKSNFEREADKLHRLVNKNENDIDTLETGALLTNQRLSNIENSTNRIEQRLSQLVNILADSGDITARDKSRWEFQPIPDINGHNNGNGDY